MRFLSVCSGVEAASVAFGPLGWQAVGFAEIEKFPCALLAARYGSNRPGEPLAAAGIPNFGDFTTIPTGPHSPLGQVDILCGGTPCQSFSVAGARKSLSDARGNLTLAYVALAHDLVRYHGLKNLLWENVPGVLSTKDNAFGCFLGALVGHDSSIPAPRGKRWPNAGLVCGPRGRAAWRVFDAQYFGLAQRRARVFLVADFGDGADPAAVLFEPQSVQGPIAPRQKTRKDLAGALSARTRGGGGLGTDFDLDGGLIAAFGGGNCSGAIDRAATLTAKGQRCDFEVETLITHALAEAYDLRGRDGGAQFEGPHDTAALRAASGGSSRSYVATAGLHNGAIGADGLTYAVRRLTPLECERLQGLPDGYTALALGGKAVDDCPDGPRYKALGNSWAVPVVRWIGARIQASGAAR